MIEIEHLGFRAIGPREPILSDISLRIGPGERVGIIGPSGSGKTTLALHLAGLHHVALLGEASGSLRLDGLDCLRDGCEGFAGVVLQNPEVQLFGETVEEEILLSLRHRREIPDVAKELDRCLALFDLAPLRHRRVASLSLGWKQRLSIVSMLALAPRVLLLDEPTSYLDESAAVRLFEILSAQTAGGLTVLLIEHDQARLRPWASRLIALRGGRMVFDGPAADCPPEAPFKTGCPPPVRSEDAPVLSVEHVSHGYKGHGRVLRDVSFQIRPGEIVALTGANGSGKTTLLHLVKGLLEPDEGRITCADGARMDTVGLVFQNPDSQLFAHSVFEECAFLPRNQKLPDAEVAERTSRALAQAGLAGHSDRVPFSLSYGEKRRLTLASTISGRSAVLCLDEPTVGLDEHCLARLAETVFKAAARGVAVLMATHDAGFIHAVATRVITLDNGRAVETPATGGGEP